MFLGLHSHALVNFVGLLFHGPLLLKHALLAQQLRVTLEFFDHSLPLLSLSIFAALHWVHGVRIRLLKHSRIFKSFIRQCEIVVADHVQLGLQWLRLHSLHACLVTLIYDRDQEIHKNNIPAQHHEQIGNPSHYFVRRLLNVEGTLSPDDTEWHDDEADSSETITIGIRVIKNDHQDHTEGRYHHHVVGEKNTKVLEHSLDHLNQKAKGVKNLKWLVYLHEGQHYQNDVN